MTKNPPPSKRKYDEKNPSVTFRMSKDEKLKLERMSQITGKSISELIHEFFFDPIHGAITIFDIFIEYGKNLEQEYNKIFYFCSICNEKMFLEPNTRAHHAMIQYMLDHGWGHGECHEKNRQNKQ